MGHVIDIISQDVNTFQQPQNATCQTFDKRWIEITERSRTGILMVVGLVDLFGPYVRQNTRLNSVYYYFESALFGIYYKGRGKFNRPYKIRLGVSKQGSLFLLVQIINLDGIKENNNEPYLNGSLENSKLGHTKQIILQTVLILCRCISV